MLASFEQAFTVAGIDIINYELAKKTIEESLTRDLATDKRVRKPSSACVLECISSFDSSRGRLESGEHAD